MFSKKDKQLECLEELAKQEDAIAALYNQFSYLNQGKNEFWFWSHLYEEEKKHAKYIRDLMEKFKAEKIYVDFNRFPVEAINTSINHIERLIEKAKNGEMDLQRQFTAAMDLEKALIEKKFFEVGSTDDKDLKIVLNKLENETREHFNSIQKECKK